MSRRQTDSRCPLPARSPTTSNGSFRRSDAATAAMGTIRQVIRSAMTAALPRRRFIVRGPRSAQQVALTFDEGPHPEHTPRLLDELARHDIKATFFVVGREAERHPGIVERAAREGHAIGHHSWTHSEPSETPAPRLLDEVRRSIELLQSITG